MTSAGSPEIQNLIPMEHLGTTAFAAWKISFVVAIAMAIIGCYWINWMVKRAVSRGETFIARGSDAAPADYSKLPSPLLCLIPLAAVLGLFLLFQYPQSFGALSKILPRNMGQMGLSFSTRHRLSTCYLGRPSKTA